MTKNVECEMCGNQFYVEVEERKMDMTQGCNHYGITTGQSSPVNGFPKSYGYDNKKTLLDEFAMAAMRGLIFDVNPEVCLSWVPIAQNAYNMAAVMVKEKMKRDEMGNIKEVTE
jgi:hypothetical protein